MLKDSSKMYKSVSLSSHFLFINFISGFVLMFLLYQQKERKCFKVSALLKTLKYKIILLYYIVRFGIKKNSTSFVSSLHLIWDKTTRIYLFCCFSNDRPISRSRLFKVLKVWKMLECIIAPVTCVDIIYRHTCTINAMGFSIMYRI